MSIEFKVPPGKYNKWCERRALVCNDQAIISKANLYLRKKNLSQKEKAALFLHELVNCQGLEFVVFSSAKFKKAVNLPGNIVLVPCFYPEVAGKSWNDRLVQLTIMMQEHARFVYDGWLPISDWNIEDLRESVNHLNRILTLFSNQERIWFMWEPKYIPHQLYPPSHLIEDNHLNEITDLNLIIQTWPDNDVSAYYRGLSWLSQSLILPQPAARFLFCIVSIESLVTYIEREATNDSIFYSLKSSRPYTKEEREKCIEDTLNHHLINNPINAIQISYSKCVRSITKILQDHLKRVFINDPESYSLLFENEISGMTLYELRHKLAHGGIDMMDDVQREIISSRIWDIENITRKYYNAVLKMILDKPSFEQKMVKSISYPFQIVSHEGMYKGPILMAEIYGQKSMLT